MSGLFARLNGNQNLEELKPAELTITVQGHELIARLFAFKPGSSDTYRNNEGVVFTINGQAQGYLKANIFARKRVGLQRLAKELLMVLDCSSLPTMQRNEMFMPSRDRLVEDNPFCIEVEKKIEQALHDHQGLRALKSTRQKMDIDEQLADNKPLEDVLNRVLKNSPSIARIFGLGKRLQNPFKIETKQTSEKPFEGKQHPTFFRFAGKEDGGELARSAHLESKVRIAFDTDVVDDYFTRKVDRGIKTFSRIVNGEREPLTDFTGPNLVDGRANLTLDLPPGAKTGDVLHLELVVKDPATGSEFVNVAKIAVLAAVDMTSGSNKKKKPPAKETGEQQDGQSGLALPKTFWIKAEDVRWKNYFTDLDDCLSVIDDGDYDEKGKGEPLLKFYFNESNKSFQTELKLTKGAASIVQKQFEIGVLLVGMAMLHDNKTKKPAKASDDEEKNEGKKKEDDQVFKQIAQVSRAIAPIILPMIQTLGELADDDVDLSDLIGQAEAA
jgi:hypothetical protein